MPINSNNRVKIKVFGARGAVGIDFAGPITPGQYLVWNGDRQVIGSSGTGADAGLRTDLAAATGASLVGYKSSLSGTVSRSVLSKLREFPVSVMDYGADPTGVADSTSAINAALAGGGTILLPPGTFKVTSSILCPSGASLQGAGMGTTVINALVTSGYAVQVRGSRGAIRDMTINCSANGVNFDTNSGAANYTLENILDRVALIGPGRSATFATRSTTGVRFGYMSVTGSATYFNTVQNCVITQFDLGFNFDGEVGAASSGGNANHVIGNQVENYWIAYNIRSIENDIRGGFLHAASGNGGGEPSYGYVLENGAHYNYIDPATGEPGNFAICYRFDAATFANTINGSAAFNYPLPSTNSGDNNVIGWTGANISNLTENHYYRVKFTRALSTYTGGSYIIRWASGAGGLNAASSGSAEVLVYRGSSSVNCVIHKFNSFGVGQSINLAGVYVNGGNELEAVFFVGNNGTGTTTGVLNFSAEGVGNVASVVQINTATDAGTSDPSTYGTLRASKSYDPPSIAVGGSANTGLVVTGAAVGDYVKASFGVDMQGLSISGYVGTPNNVTVVISNNTAGAVDLGAGTLTVSVERGI